MRCDFITIAVGTVPFRVTSRAVIGETLRRRAVRNNVVRLDHSRRGTSVSLLGRNQSACVEQTGRAVRSPLRVGCSDEEIDRLLDQCLVIGAGRRSRKSLFQPVGDVPAAFDVVMAWAIDRLGRSLIDLLGIIEHLEATGVDL